MCTVARFSQQRQINGRRVVSQNTCECPSECSFAVKTTAGMDDKNMIAHNAERRLPYEPLHTFGSVFIWEPFGDSFVPSRAGRPFFKSHR